MSVARWYTYQKERFPVAAHGPLVLAFSYSALSYSSLLRGEPHPPGLREAATAFITSLLFFLQLRIADEFKDFEDDSRWRSYRPVPRGLVKLSELGRVGAGAACIQMTLALLLAPPLILPLLAAWTYLGLMSKEFFVRDWLKRHAFTYMWSHMLVMPVIDFYVTACDWLGARSGPPAGLAWFLLISFFNGMVIEIGRKIRAPGDEEPGVETYSFLWGRNRAAVAWIGAMALTAVCAVEAATRIRFVLPVAAVLLVLIVTGTTLAALYLRCPVTKTARRIEAFSGIWTLLMYLTIGAIPRLSMVH